MNIYRVSRPSKGLRYFNRAKSPSLLAKIFLSVELEALCRSMRPPSSPERDSPMLAWAGQKPKSRCRNRLPDYRSSSLPLASPPCLWPSPCPLCWEPSAQVTSVSPSMLPDYTRQRWDSTQSWLIPLSPGLSHPNRLPPRGNSHPLSPSSLTHEMKPKTPFSG